MPLNHCILATACCCDGPSQKGLKTQHCAENAAKRDRRRVMAPGGVCAAWKREDSLCFQGGAVTQK